MIDTPNSSKNRNLLALCALSLAFLGGIALGFLVAVDPPRSVIDGPRQWVVDGWMAVLLLLISFAGGMATMWAIMDGDARFVYEAWRRAAQRRGSRDAEPEADPEIRGRA